MKLDKSKLEIAMARKCIDPKALAEQAGICCPTLMRAAKYGKAKPSTIGKIADVLGVDVLEILKEV